MVLAEAIGMMRSSDWYFEVSGWINTRILQHGYSIMMMIRPLLRVVDFDLVIDE